MNNLYITKNKVIIDGNEREVSFSLPGDINSVQYFSSNNRCFEEPNYKEIEVGKYQNFIDEFNAIIETEQNIVLEPIVDEKFDGKDYLHTDEITYKVSLTADDANGITSLKVASDTFGFFATTFFCANGTKVPLEVEADMLSLGAFIASERAKFFRSE